MDKQNIHSTKIGDIKREWFLVDVKEKILGRVATDISKKLMGKDKSYRVSYLDCGNYVVVVNAKNVAVTGKKEKTKTYGHYSGYPGGLKEKALWQVRKENPTELIRHAVLGMIPKNKLQDQLMKRLFIFPDEDHPYKNKFISK